MQKRTYETFSSYKLHNSIIKRMVARTVKTSKGQKYPGCTKLMIAALIHFSHICSLSGEIDEFRIKELEQVLKCSPRATYQVIKDLQEREFITVETQNAWFGTKKITILGNDFSNYTDHDYKKNRYLNTNYDFFNYKQYPYKKFMNLSLYSMRLLLLLLHNYNFDYGYHSSFDNLTKQLGINSRSLVHKYIHEIKLLFPDSGLFVVQKNELKRLRYGNIVIRKNVNELYSPKNLFHDYQDNYYSYLWKTRLRKLGLDVTESSDVTLDSFSTRVAKIVNYHLVNTKNFTLEFIENIIHNILSSQFTLDTITLTVIDQRLRKLAEA